MNRRIYCGKSEKNNLSKEECSMKLFEPLEVTGRDGQKLHLHTLSLDGAKLFMTRKRHAVAVVWTWKAVSGI